MAEADNVTVNGQSGAQDVYPLGADFKALLGFPGVKLNQSGHLQGNRGGAHGV